jgi:hypothetical protein
MFKSKFFLVMIILTALVLAGSLALQILEMQEYDLFETLKARFFG